VPIAEGVNIERRWRRSCSVRQPEVGEGFMGLGSAQRSNGPSVTCKNKRELMNGLLESWAECIR
jgi:hypothetical protein